MDISDGVSEPFRSDAQFWRSVAASADAAAALLVAIGAALVIELTVGGAWCLLPFAVPAPMLVRAAHAARVSAGRRRAAFASEPEWRDAERQAVAQVFVRVLVRNRLRRPQERSERQRP